jgi:hypothetical protein
VHALHDLHGHASAQALELAGAGIREDLDRLPRDAAIKGPEVLQEKGPGAPV